MYILSWLALGGFWSFTSGSLLPLVLIKSKKWAWYLHLCRHNKCAHILPELTPIYCCWVARYRFGIPTSSQAEDSHKTQTGAGLLVTEAVWKNPASCEQNYLGVQQMDKALGNDNMISTFSTRYWKPCRVDEVCKHLQQSSLSLHLVNNSGLFSSLNASTSTSSSASHEDCRCHHGVSWRGWTRTFNTPTLSTLSDKNNIAFTQLYTLGLIGDQYRMQFSLNSVHSAFGTEVQSAKC